MSRRCAAAAPLLLGLALAPAVAQAGRADVGGYFRVAARPDLQGGSGRLGYWNLYGRLLNEGPYAAVELKYDVLERRALTADPYTSLHLRIEGGSIGNASPDNGSLSAFRMSQLYARAGNVGIPHTTFQVGTLDQYIGELGLYDMRPAQVFFETVGASARYERERVDLLLGVGDSGFWLKRERYNAVWTGGGLLRVRPIDRLEIGGGGMIRYEAQVRGNQFAPHDTPRVRMDDLLRGEVVERFAGENPLREWVFPDPVPTDARSWKGVGYLGFGGFGPVRWNNFFASVERRHPEDFVTETFQGQSYRIYTRSLTDERTVLLLGDEIQIRLWPDHLDLVWAGLYGRHTDADNAIAPSDHARTYRSTVLRLQAYVTDTVHWLGEGSAAEEVSTNGNAYRQYQDSIFRNTNGVPDVRGFENGDTDTRVTFQGKTGVVLNPLGPGVYVRPSLRFLYGVQWSNQNNAFGNSFVETIDQFNAFGNVEQRLHHVLSLETEAWF